MYNQETQRDGDSQTAEKEGGKGTSPAAGFNHKRPPILNSALSTVWTLYTSSFLLRSMIGACAGKVDIAVFQESLRELRRKG